MINTFVAILLEKAIRSYLQLAPATQEKLLPLQGKVLKMELKGWDEPFYFLLQPEGILVHNHYEGKVDASIKGSPITLLHISFGNEAQIEKLSETVQISGDAELAKTISKIIQDSHIDWEEPLSRLLGDTVSHQIGNVVRSTRDWGKDALKNLQQHISEYLQHEQKHLPPTEEVKEFCAEVTELHQDVNSLEKRWRERA